MPYIMIAYLMQFVAVRIMLIFMQFIIANASAQDHSGNRITAYTIAQVGTRFDDETLRISVALRVGLNVCLAHKCRCVATVLSNGQHPPS